MSSKITVKFEFVDNLFPDQEPMVLVRSFTVRHLRNMVVTENGGIDKDQFGGYTVLADETGALTVSKCHPKHDKFCRHIGLKEALKHWLLTQKNPKNLRPLYSQYIMTSLISESPNNFISRLELNYGK